MPIKGLTTRQDIIPSLPRLGKLRKGGEKSGNKPGADLDHFRFTSHDPQIVAAFNDAHSEQDKVRTVNALLFFPTVEDNFSTWIEEWDASGLVWRGDGEFDYIWREGDRYKNGKRPHVKTANEDRNASIVGRLQFLVPGLIERGYVGFVTLETHSNHDLRNIASVLMAGEQQLGSLAGMQIVLRRVKENISVPGFGKREGQRSRADKWLVRVELPQRAFTRALMDSAQNAERPALTAEPQAIEADYAEVPAGPTADDLADPQVITVAGTALQDLTPEQVLFILDNPTHEKWTSQTNRAPWKVLRAVAGMVEYYESPMAECSPEELREIVQAYEHSELNRAERMQLLAAKALLA